MLHRYIYAAHEIMDVLDSLPFDRLIQHLRDHTAEDILEARIVWC